MRGGFQIYQVSEREYKLITGFYKVLTITGGAAALAGLAGIVASQFISPESSESIKQLLSYSQLNAVGGGLATVYFGLNYLANKDLNKNRQAAPEKQ